jgi:uncharacterized damage-inducible protein DinB
MSTIVESIRAEYLRYKTLAEGAIDQLDDADLAKADARGSNSIAVLCWHISGNLKSRFTDFLSSDGEKPWRDREEEFNERNVGRGELLEKWNAGWKVLLDTLSGLTDDDLKKTVTIRQQPLIVHEALHRSLSHTVYHVGQIVYIAKELRGAAWSSLSIPRGQSATYNQAPKYETAAAQQAALASRIKPK